MQQIAFWLFVGNEKIIERTFMSRALELLGTLRAVWGWKAAAEPRIRLAMVSFMVGYWYLEKGFGYDKRIGRTKSGRS